MKKNKKHSWPCKSGDVVEIGWNDAIATTEHQNWLKDFDFEQVKKDMPHRDYGVVVHLDKDFISITSSFRVYPWKDGDQSVGIIKHIGIGMINKVKILKKATSAKTVG